MVVEPIVELLEDILGDHKNHNEFKQQISFDCPVCSYEIKGLDHGDGKGNLEVNYGLGVYKCWSCGETHGTHGSLFSLIKKHGTKKHLNLYDIVKPDSTLIFDNKKKEVKLPKEYIMFTTASRGLKLTHHYKNAFNYLKKRNITIEMCEKFKIGFAYEGDYAQRIIIPTYDKYGDLTYFIARTYANHVKMKYKNPESQKDLIIFNENLINWEEEIYLVEGVFDSIFLPNSIPLLGKVLSERLFDELYNKAQKITIILDGDAWENSLNLYHKINIGRLFNKVFLVKLPKDKDIADLNGDISNFSKIQID